MHIRPRSFKASNSFNLPPSLLQRPDNMRPRSRPILCHDRVCLLAIRGPLSLKVVRETEPNARHTVYTLAWHNNLLSLPHSPTRRARNIQYALLPQRHLRLHNHLPDRRHRLDIDGPTGLGDPEQLGRVVTGTSLGVEVAHARAVHLAHEARSHGDALERHGGRQCGAADGLMVARRANSAVLPSIPSPVAEVLVARAEGQAGELEGVGLQRLGVGREVAL